MGIKPKSFYEEIREGLRTTPRDTVIELVFLVLFGAPLIIFPALVLYWTVCNLLLVIGVTDWCWLSTPRN